MDTHIRCLPGHPVVWLPCAAAAAVLLSGCGGGTHPVQGQVVFKDTGAAATELVGYTVSLESVDGKVSASGLVKPDGTFEVGTHKPGDGAVPGNHRVALNPPASHELIEGPDAKPPTPLIPEKYGTFAKSGLEITVERSGQEIVLEVERAGP